MIYEVGSMVLNTGENRHSPFYEILVRAADTHARKNRNYAGDGANPFKNFQECEDFNIPAWKGALVRMSDKWMRIKNLAKGIPDLVGESLEDTLLDLGVYSFICICLLMEAIHDSREKSVAETGS
jgi:hypothetical protein